MPTGTTIAYLQDLAQKSLSRPALSWGVISKAAAQLQGFDARSVYSAKLKGQHGKPASVRVKLWNFSRDRIRSERVAALLQAIGVLDSYEIKLSTSHYFSRDYLPYNLYLYFPADTQPTEETALMLMMAVQFLGLDDGITKPKTPGRKPKQPKVEERLDGFTGEVPSYGRMVNTSTWCSGSGQASYRLDAFQDMLRKGKRMAYADRVHAADAMEALRHELAALKTRVRAALKDGD